MISEVKPDTLSDVWGRLRPQILKALSCGMGDSTTEKTLYDAVLSRDMVMWALHDTLTNIQCCVILSIKDYPAKRSLFVELLAGNGLDEWIAELEDVLEQYRQAIEADRIEACCRKGLSKRLDRWRTKAVMMEYTG